ncbi:hypothetical protein [Nocardia sp. XZ_19_231]|uniref:hypothetical protein n=1 Tax=Nocardia sp. XZ_19_231 TaxID=2769252 RepID=UPI0018909066|nr:hypothetical protein [Nocardia sp. XZ_19_231]
MPKNQTPIPVPVANMPASEANKCDKCSSPTCLALMRAETPPVNLLDFLDRQIKLITSNHWTWSTIGYCAALAFAVVPLITVVYSVPGPVV